MDEVMPDGSGAGKPATEVAGFVGLQVPYFQDIARLIEALQALFLAAAQSSGAPTLKRIPNYPAHRNPTETFAF